MDLSEFDLSKPVKKDEKFTFFHPGGWGGVNNRKNTQVVIDAFLKLNNPDTKLVITSQKPINYPNKPDNIEIIDKNLPRKSLLELYREADVTVLPSKWETVGIPILESLTSGTPVITTNIPPMNEFIRTGLNGYLCSFTLGQYKGIYIAAAEVDVKELKSKMELCLNRELLSILKKNCRRTAEEFYDIDKNKHYFIDFLKKELGE
jgi:glycosyltransferase involved in cell wall biosynthesis